MRTVKIEPQPESYDSTPTTGHLHLLHMQVGVGVNNLPKVATW